MQIMAFQDYTASITAIIATSEDINVDFEGMRSSLAEDNGYGSKNLRTTAPEERNLVFKTESDLFAQHDDGLPIITSVFSLSPTSCEIEQENQNMTMERFQSQDTYFSTKPMDYPEERNISPTISTGHITVFSQTQEDTIGDINQDIIDPGFSTGCYMIEYSDTKFSRLLRPSSTSRYTNKLELHSEISEKNTLSQDFQTRKQSYSQNLEKRNAVAYPAKAMTMAEREKRIQRLRELLRQKEAEVEKVRFCMKKKSLAATIDKLKGRLPTISNSLSDQTYFARKNQRSSNQSSSSVASNLCHNNSCPSVHDLYVDGIVGEDEYIKTEENIKYQHNKTS